MEFSLSVRYHEVMSHLLMSGIHSVESLVHTLYKTRTFTLNDLCQIQKENSLKTKVQILLDRVMYYECTDLFLESLNQTLPQVAKALLMDQTNVSMHSGSPDLAESRSTDTGSDMQYSQLYIEQLSDERNLLKSQVGEMSSRLSEIQEKLKQSQIETANLVRQSEADKQELAMMRRRSLMGGGSSSIINQMYEKMLERYDEQKKKLSEETNERNKIQNKLEIYMRELSDANTRCDSIVLEHEKMAKQFISLNKRNENIQNDLNRVREERTNIRREYALVMSERDNVLKNIEKLQEEITEVNKEMEKSVNDKKLLIDEKEQLKTQLNSYLQNKNISQSTAQADIHALREEMFVAQRERKQALAQYEAELNKAYSAKKAQEQAIEMAKQLQKEKDSLSATVAALKADLRDVNKEASDANRLRQVAFSERDLMRSECDELKRATEKLEEDRERLIKQLKTEIEEHDTTKEVKKRLSKEVRVLRDREGMAKKDRDENCHSHDSAIDAGEWGSEELRSLHNEGTYNRRAKTLTYTITKPNADLSVEVGLFVSRSGLRGLNNNDRIISINNIIVDSKNCHVLKGKILNSGTCILKVLRPSSLSTSASRESHDNNNIFANSLNGEYIPNSPDSALYAHREFADACCQTNETHSNRGRIWKNNRNLHVKSLIIPSSPPESTIPNYYPQPTSPSITGLSSEGESLVTAFSDSTNNSAQLTHQLSQKSSDSSTSCAKKSSKSSSSSRFKWKRKKKNKSSNDDNKKSSGGTWPRLESPPLSNTGRLSVFNSKKKSRPTFSQNTFTPPLESSIGRTPPTLRAALHAHNPPTVTNEMEEENDDHLFVSDVEPVAPTRYKTAQTRVGSKSTNFKRQRPLSAPMGNNNLSLQQPMKKNMSNNNNAVATLRPQSLRPGLLTKKSTESTAVKSTVTSFSKGLSSTPVSHGRSNTPTSTQSIPSASKVHETISPPIPTEIQATHSERLGSPFSLPLSSPSGWADAKMATLPSPITSGKSPDMSMSTRVTNGVKHRSTHSLTRPSSARTISSSHASIENHSHKSRTLECKRIRIPSEVSVGIRLSGSERGSISISSDRSTPVLFTPSHSPSPRTPDQGFIPGISATSISISSTMSTRGRRRRKRRNKLILYRSPTTSKPRLVEMIKGTEAIGISIVGGGDKGGIFVSRIIEDSLAARAGLEYGDQLLEYNGINLRSATEIQARAIMSQAHPMDTITFLAQYNLEKYKTSIESNLSDTLGMKKPNRSSFLYPSAEDKDEGTITPDTTPRASPHVEDALQTQSLTKPRYIFLSGNCEGVTLCGGNRYGIYISEIVEIESPENQMSLKVGDKLLEYNGVDMQNVTLERASLLINKPVLNASFQVIHDITKFTQISTIAGDFFYVRALYDNVIESGPGNLCFSRNTILLVDDTFPDRKIGSWSAWLVDEQGEKTTRGRIPSKFSIEKDNFSQRDLDDSVSCAGSTTGKKLGVMGRRSFFKRRRPHRTSSRSSGEVRMQKSHSETSIESTETSFEHIGSAYQIVEKHISEQCRPVVIFGPHSSQVSEKLCRDHAVNFTKCQLEILSKPEEPVDLSVIETYKKASETLALSVTSLKQTIRQSANHHVLLEVSHDAIDRLHAVQIYPIIVFIDFNSAKKIKECQERIPGREKLSMKQSKEMLENANNVKKYIASKYLGTVYIHGGSSTAVANQVRTIVDHEQSKVLWLPAKNDLLNY